MNDALHPSHQPDLAADVTHPRSEPGRPAIERPTWASQMAAARKVLEAYLHRRAPTGGTPTR